MLFHPAEGVLLGFAVGVLIEELVARFEQVVRVPDVFVGVEAGGVGAAQGAPPGFVGV